MIPNTAQYLRPLVLLVGCLYLVMCVQDDTHMSVAASSGSSPCHMGHGSVVKPATTRRPHTTDTRKILLLIFTSEDLICRWNLLPQKPETHARWKIPYFLLIRRAGSIIDSYNRLSPKPQTLDDRSRAFTTTTVCDPDCPVWLLNDCTHTAASLRFDGRLP